MAHDIQTSRNVKCGVSIEDHSDIRVSLWRTHGDSDRAISGRQSSQSQCTHHMISADAQPYLLLLLDAVILKNGKIASIEQLIRRE